MRAIYTDPSSQALQLHAMEARARSLCTKLLGVWAAEQMGRDEDAAHRYADALARECGRVRDPVAAVREDLKSAGFAPGDRALRLQYDDFLHQARASVAVN